MIALILVFAHAADVVTSIITMVPVLGLLIWLIVAGLRDRRKADRKARSSGARPGRDN